MKEFKRGDQIIYDSGDDLKSGLETGFVTNVHKGTVFCRFWSKLNHGCLRTLANSEGCDPESISMYASDIPHDIINAWLGFLDYEF